ncbi:MAG: KOW domain-containing RNA-binding protein [Clostridia bacterium]|nr:KOW domain-containing RNA-binding protein [Clostridia bacterium]
MDRLPIERGRVVLSIQGRDAGRYFVVLSKEDKDFVLISDGASRKLCHPKRKKIKHLRAKPACMDVDGSFPSGHMLDSDLRSFLNDQGYGLSNAPVKED